MPLPATGLLGLLVGLAACDGDGPAATVEMIDNSFEPAVVEIPAGGTIRFENHGNSPHNAIAVDGTWSTEEAAGGLAIDPGGAAEVTLERAGRYRFYCSFHATPDGRRGMTGVAVVGGAIGEEIAGDEEEGPAPTREPTGTTRRVPADHPSIQAAVDAADPGDLVLIGPGTYREQVTVTTPSLVLRGTDRNRVVLDGEFERPNGIEVLGADGVAIENMTARNYLLNGFYWTGVTGYRGSYLTAYNNADYGIYAFDSTDGVFEHSYASGSPDAGFYIGQCHPCRAIVHRVIAEHNALGYSGTNAGGELYIVGSVWRHNKAGIVPNTLDSEALAPERETTIAANLIVDNNDESAPAKPLQYPPIGTGVAVAGGRDNLIAHNVIARHANHGVLIAPNVDRNFWFAVGNVVRDNIVAGSGRGDLVLGAPAGPGNCFANNRARTSLPPAVQALHGCAGGLPALGDIRTTMRLLGYTARAASGDYPRGEPEAQPAPPDQPGMPAGTDAPVRPAHDVFATYEAVDVTDLAGIPLPPEVEALGLTRSMETDMNAPTVEGPGFWGQFFAFYGYLLPVALVAAWIALAFWDLARRDDLSRSAALGWIATILLIPVLGVIAYHAIGGARLPGWLRAAVVGGGIVVYVAAMVLGLIAGGLV